MSEEIWEDTQNSMSNGGCLSCHRHVEHDGSCHRCKERMCEACAEELGWPIVGGLRVCFDCEAREEDEEELAVTEPALLDSPNFVPESLRRFAVRGFPRRGRVR